MKNRFLLVGAAFLLSTMTVNAVPAKPVKKTVRQADGTLIELTLRGDEHYSFYTAEDGTPYQLKADGQLLRLTREEVSERWTALRNERLAADPRRANARMKSPKEVGVPNVTTGKHRGLVILVEFSDVKFASADPQATFNRFFNEEGYHEYGNAGSVKDYFLKQSYGKLEIDFDVVGPYTTGGKLATYGAQIGDVSDVNPTAMVMEGIDQAAKDVDFSNYDWDNDGEVDQIFLICAGYDQAEGADGDYIWPHEWNLEAQGIQRKYNGKRLNTYGVATELWGDGKNTNLDKTIAGIGTACHEFSHCLGLPDFYDTGSSGGFGMHIWSVMDYGPYLDGGHTPPGYTSYERWFAGWLEPTELKEMTTVTDMKPLVTTPEAYILYNEGNKKEFYLLENRQPVDFDAKLPGHGMLVLHVDYDAGAWMTNSVNTDVNHQCMTIIPADGKLAYTSSSLQGDPFPGTSGKTALATYTTPAATVYKANADGRLLMNKDIDSITESEDGLISFVACRPELAVPEPDGGKEIEGEASFTVSWPAVSGAASYELEVTELSATPTNPSEAMLREYTFEKTISESVGFTDISSKLNSYGLNGWSGSKLYTTPDKLRLGTTTAKGSLTSPFYKVPDSSELTIVFGPKVYKEGTPVKCMFSVRYANEGDPVSTASHEDVRVEVTGNNKFILHYSIRKELFRIEIAPEAQMYMDYLAIYDGNWTAEQLGIEATIANARLAAPRKAGKTTTYETTEPSYTLKDLNTNSRFAYRVRAVGEANNYSQWSEEKTFQFKNSSSINPVTYGHRNTEIYDLQGRRLDNSRDALPKGIYIIDGKKVVK